MKVERIPIRESDKKEKSKRSSYSFMRVSQLVLPLIFICFSFWAKAQKFTVTSSASDVVAKQAFDVSFTIENGKGAEFSPPNFSPARIVGGPFTSQQTSIINGVSSYSKSYTYRIAYEKPGTYTIPKAKIKYGNYTKSSKELKIKVLKAGSSANSIGEDLYLEKKISDTTIYVGQQFFVDHHIFFRNVNVRGVSLVDGFKAEQFINFRVHSANRLTPTQKQIDGKLINTAWVSRLAFFALRSGEFEIPDIMFKVDIQKQSSGNRRSIFRNFYDRKVLQSDAFGVTILPLPTNAPESFTGAVGRLSATSSVSNGPKEVGKEILVQLEMIGNGIMNQVNAPKWQQEGFEIFDPKLVGEDRREQNGEVVFQKTYEYIVIPQINGKQRLEIPYAYFDTENGEYVEKVSRSTEFDVRGDAANLLDATSKDIKGIASPGDAPWYTRLWVWGIVVALLGFVLFYFATRTKKEEEVEVAEEEAALIVAKRKLASAKSILDSGDTSKYWETLESSLRIYLEEKIGIGTTAYSMERVETFWADRKLPSSLLEKYQSMVEKINLARYAGQSISDMQNLYKEGEDWIVGVERVESN